jgi:hypothetical protein
MSDGRRRFSTWSSNQHPSKIGRWGRNEANVTVPNMVSHASHAQTLISSVGNSSTALARTVSDSANPPACGLGLPEGIAGVICSAEPDSDCA